VGDRPADHNLGAPAALPSKYCLIMTATSQVPWNITRCEECRISRLSRCRQFAPNAPALVDYQNAVTSGVIGKEVDICQSFNLDMQPCLLVDFSHHGLMWAFIAFRIARWQIPAKLKGCVSSLEQQ
jgi:hypothetical protein